MYRKHERKISGRLTWNNIMQYPKKCLKIRTDGLYTLTTHCGDPKNK